MSTQSFIQPGLKFNFFTAPFEGTGFDPEIMYYRIGVKTGGYTSGTAVVRLGREDKDRH